MSWSIRELSEADLDALERVERSAHQRAPATGMSLDALQGALSAPCARGFGVEVDHQLVAFVIVWLVLDELTIMDVVTDAAHQRQGIARALLAWTLDWGLERGAAMTLLEVRAGNLGALALYHALGFEEIGLRRGYYSDGEDAIVMQRLSLTAQT